MRIGEKIREARIAKKMTQSELVGDVITRNMLSAIESGKALPSLDTLSFLAEKLDLPVSYILSEDDLSLHKKSKLISDIRTAFSTKKYAECISMIDEIGCIDDELAYILAYSNYELGVISAKSGAFSDALKYLSQAKDYSDKTIYDTRTVKCKIPLYMSFLKNTNAPLLDFDIDAFIEMMSDTMDLDFFKYLCNDFEYEYKNTLFRKHFEAKAKIRERRYIDAISILLEIVESKNIYGYNAYFTYSVYGDLENCYKQICDFENAYKYSGKRISMLEGFN